MQEKKENNCFFLVLFFALLPCSVAQLLRKGQNHVLRNLYKEGNFRFDSSLFHGIHPVDARKIYPQVGLKEKDIIVKLPGQPEVDFSQYGGYVPVDESAGRALFYYFVEASQSKDSSPFLLWLNGGPGCSSLGYGAMQELGPFRVLSDGKTLFRNTYSWNNVANVLFLESPAGIGFSYSNRTSDYLNNGDKQTAEDNFVFLLNWLERFPEYKDREFYISGESYAGHYIPQLAQTILEHNKKAKKTIINLKGIIIGNAMINDETDTPGMYDYFHSHALISDEVALSIQKHCDFSPNENPHSKACSAALIEANETYDILDIYNIYAPVCTDRKLTSSPRKPSDTFDPCSRFYVHAYINQPEVKEAFHASRLDFDWTACNDTIYDSWQDSPSTIVPTLRELMASGLRVWLYSGDVDGRIPVTSTRSSINAMKVPVKTPWRPWFVDGEVGGFTEVYKGDFTFATVRGAGHEVPSYQPERALTLIQHFLAGTPLPNTTKLS